MLSSMRRRTRAGDSPSELEPHLRYPMYGNGLHLPVLPSAMPGILETVRCAEQPSDDGVFLVDWAGIRTRIGMLPWAPQELAGTTTTTLPIPTDGYRSEAEEYAGLVLSITNERDDYFVIEAGSGWAPWTVGGIVLARRAGQQARGIAVEADPIRAGWAMQHAADNGVSAELITGTPAQIARQIAERRDQVEMLVVLAACWSTETTLRFPTLSDEDMGGAVLTDHARTMDYRGAHFDHVDVPTVTLETLVGDAVAVDLMHVDLQGQELEVVLPANDLIEQRVRFLAVGTHNRYVEGMLQEHFLRREWALLMESPSTAVFDGVKPSLTGFTVQDGNQLWANSRFRDAADIVIRSR